MAKTSQVIHQNYVDRESNKIYCRLTGKVEEVDYNKCDTCPYFFGSLQGQGIECKWEDSQEYSIVDVTNPNKELMRVAKLIDNGTLSKS